MPIDRHPELFEARHEANLQLGLWSMAAGCLVQLVSRSEQQHTSTTSHAVSAPRCCCRQVVELAAARNAVNSFSHLNGLCTHVNWALTQSIVARDHLQQVAASSKSVEGTLSG
eukprot:COSAG01_NODE_3912_length_5546_cov_49.202680_3_plen_113_part_00